MTTQEIKDHEKYLINIAPRPINLNDFELVPVYEHVETGMLEISGPGWSNEFVGFLLKPKLERELK